MFDWYITVYLCNWPASWSSGQSFWLLILRLRVRFSALPWEFSLKEKEGEDSHGDHGLGRLVEFRFKVPLGTTSSPITSHTQSGERNSPHGRPKFRSRFNSFHAQEGGPRSPQRTYGGSGENMFIYILNIIYYLLLAILGQWKKTISIFTVQFT
jgi:hypothetical protein